jgi:hypothetical protein
LDPDKFVSETAMKNTAKAKAFDTARYTLLTCLPTALGFTMPTRESERRISGWLASPHVELAEAAAEIHRGCVTYNAGLLTHVKPNRFQHRQVTKDLAVAAMSGIAETALQWQKAIDDESYDEPMLIQPAGQQETFLHELAASVLKKSTGTNLPTCVIADHLWSETDIDGTRSAHIVAERLQTRTRHDELPEEFAIGQFQCEVTLDYGAFRDLQRHRVGTLVCSDLDASFGYEVPDLLKDPKFSGLHTIYCEYMDHVAAFHSLVRNVNPRSLPSIATSATYTITLADGTAIKDLNVECYEIPEDQL